MKGIKAVIMIKVSWSIFNIKIRYSYFSSTEEVCDLQLYRMSQEECARLREGFPYVKVYRYNPKHLYPKLNGYGGNGQRSLKL